MFKKRINGLFIRGRVKMFKSCFLNRSTREFHVWDDKNGYNIHKYEPYAYTYGNGEYTSMFGDQLIKITGDDILSYRNEDLFESDVIPENRMLIDLYQETDDIPNDVKVMFFDIEIDTSNKLDILNTPSEITAIALSMRDSDNYNVYILDKDSILSENIKNNVYIKPFISEKELLKTFIEDFRDLDPDIIVGWNNDDFDNKYIINRIKKVLGVSYANQLSRIGILKTREDDDYTIAGIHSLDYMKLYKKFTYKNRPSYKLDAISKIEVNEGKVEFDGNLDILYKTDIEKYIEYNITDVKLLKLLDQKLQFIDLAISISCVGHIPYDRVYHNSIVIDGALLTYLRRNNKIAPNKKKIISLKNNFKLNKGDTHIVLDKIIPSGFPRSGVIKIIKNKITKKYKFKQSYGNNIILEEPIDYIFPKGCEIKYNLEGAYVEDPLSGRYNYLYSLDVESLYPSIIRTLKISPETKIGRITNWRDIYFMSNFHSNYNGFKNKDYFSYLEGVEEIEILTNGKIQKIKTEKFIQTVKDNNLIIAGNGTIYREDQSAIIPNIISDWFMKRKKYKNLRDTAKENNDKNNYILYNLYQMVQKVLLNSIYGVMALESSRIYDLDNAEAVTLTGQDLIIFSQKMANKKYNEDYLDEKKYVIYSDTDSVCGSSVVHSWEMGSLSIEELWDKLHQKPYKEKYILKEYERDGREFIHPLNIKFPYHYERHRINKYGDVEYIERHKVKTRLIRVITYHGKFVDLTPEHNVMIMDFDDPKKRMITKKAADLKPGSDQVYLCNSPHSYSRVSAIVDLGESERYVYDVGMKNNPRVFYANDIMVHNSVYVKFPDKFKDLDEMIEHSSIIEKYINEKLVEFAKYHMNSNDSHLRFQREKIAKSGFWLTKKRYALHVEHEDGYKVDKFSFTGLDLVRSSFPVRFQTITEEILKDILFFVDVDTINRKIEKYYNEIMEIDFRQLSRTTSVKSIEEYNEITNTINNFKTGTPIGIKAALAYNRLLEYMKVGNSYLPITSSDKIKYVKLKENPYNLEVLAYKDFNDPKEIIDYLDKYVDRKGMYQHELESKIKSYFDALKWNYLSPENNAVNDFFGF